MVGADQAETSVPAGGLEKVADAETFRGLKIWFHFNYI